MTLFFFLTWSNLLIRAYLESLMQTLIEVCIDNITALPIAQKCWRKSHRAL